MAQIQFRSDDTIPWTFGFGRGKLGDLTPSTSALSFTGSSFTGTSGQYTGTVGSSSGMAVGDFVRLWQRCGTGATGVNWQLNVIMSIAGTTIGFLYPLTMTYATGAQLLVAKEYSNITIGSGVTLSACGIIFVKGTLAINSGVLGYTGYYGGGGFGGDGSNTIGIQGFGYGSATQAEDYNQNGNGGGGGIGDPTDYTQGAGGGGGGANASNGTGGNSSDGNGGGYAGLAYGGSGGTILSFGGGGGGGGSSGNQGGSGGSGGGELIVIAKNITTSGTGKFVSNGTDGQTPGDNYWGGGGGGGAGGTFLLKCQTGSIGSSSTCNAGAGAIKGAKGGSGGNGSVGRFFVDYMISFSGSSTPALISRQDFKLYHPSKRRLVI